MCMCACACVSVCVCVCVCVRERERDHGVQGKRGLSTTYSFIFRQKYSIMLRHIFPSYGHVVLIKAAALFKD
jgi:hypothetical protein